MHNIKKTKLAPAIIAAKNTFDSVSFDICRANPTAASFEQHDRFVDNINALIDFAALPDDLFNYKNHGSFKQCYDSGIDGWIIKFYTTECQIGAERQILEAAKERGIGQLFVPTYIIELPRLLDAVHIDSDGSCQCSNCGGYDDDYTGKGDCDDDSGSYEQLCGAILQPEVLPLEAIPYTSVRTENQYLKQPLYWTDGSIIDYAFFTTLDIDYREWLQDVIRLYGDETFRTFRNFIEEYNLDDLHSGNLGYMTTPNGDIPIILDWLSSVADYEPHLAESITD
jgi:hypothetical protein